MSANKEKAEIFNLDQKGIGFGKNGMHRTKEGYLRTPRVLVLRK
jgi:hypothetical protein